MSLTSPLLQHPALSKFKSLNLSTPFLNGSTSPSLLTKPSSRHSFPVLTAASPLPPIRAMRTMQGKVICATSDKTVNVEVVRLAPHPKYKRRVRKIKKYQAHDPENRFKVGDIVLLEKIRPISKKKTHLALPAPSRNVRKSSEEEAVPQELQLPLESLQAQ